MELSLSIIVKNDKEGIIRCLKSCEHIFDEIVVIDTGSTDGTIDALEKYQRDCDCDKFVIGHFDWIDDFAAARNYALSKCTSDWVMWLDSDDVLKKPGCIRSLFEQFCKEYDAILMPYHYASDANGKPFINLTRERIIKRELAHWIYPIHECMEMKFPRMFTTYGDDYAVTHMRSEQAFLKDRGRNLAILEKNFDKFPNDHRCIYYYGNELRDAGKLEKAVEMYESLDKINGFLEEKYLAHVSSAICYMQLKNSGKAIEHANKAISLCPQYYDAYYVLGTIYEELGSFDRSIMMFEICARSQFKKMDLTNREDIRGYKPFEFLERLYSKSGDYERCLTACEKLLEYFPMLPSLLHDKRFCRDRIIEKNMKKIETMKPSRIWLDLGAGAKHVPGYITCDKYDKDADLNFDMTFIPFTDKSVERIRSEHSLEHLTANNARECLAECFRVMKPGAVLELEIPNFEESACGFIGNAKRGVNQVSDWYSKTIWGRQYTDNKIDLGQFHTCGFTREYIKSLLRNAGFQVISMHDSNKYGTPSIEIIAVRMVKMYYYDTGDKLSATCRLRRYPIHSSNVKDVPLWVIRLNMLPDPSHKDMLSDADIVMFTSYHAETMKLLLELRGKTQRWFDHNEGIFFCTEVMPVLKEIDVIVCCTNKLAEMTEEALGQKGKCAVMFDSYEHTLNGVW